MLPTAAHARICSGVVDGKGKANTQCLLVTALASKEQTNHISIIDADYKCTAHLRP